MRKSILLFVLLLMGLSNKVLAQQSSDGPVEPNVDVQARFPGDSLHAFLSRNLRYPEAMREMGVDGKVFVQMVVGADGAISQVTVLRSSGHAELDGEALRVMRLMPKWIPAKKDGRNVASRYRQPVTFRLDGRAPVRQPSNPAGQEKN